MSKNLRMLLAFVCYFVATKVVGSNYEATNMSGIDELKHLWLKMRYYWMEILFFVTGYRGNKVTKATVTKVM